MADLRRIVHAGMVSLVRSLGCYDAAAETINSRWGGGVSKGTISKKMAGQLDWTLADSIALEDAMGQFPVTRALALRRSRRQVDEGSLMARSGVIARESGEAISAILAAEQSLSARDRAQAVQEVSEAIEALEGARAHLLALPDDGGDA